MAIKEYQKLGTSYFKVYCQIPGKKNKRLRIQRTIYRIETYAQAVKEEKKLIKTLAEELSKLEGKGLFWGDITIRWELAAKHGHLGERFSNPDYILTHVKRLRRHTMCWFDRAAADLTKGDGRHLLNQLRDAGFSHAQVGKVKTSINLVYKWGIEERFINAHGTPVEGLSFIKEEEAVPRILTLDEVRKLLQEAQIRSHPWYHIWAFALLTGMRSGELLALKWSDIELDKMMIRVSRSFNSKRKIEKSTKSGCWRTVPISSELLQIINEIKLSDVSLVEDFVLPRNVQWINGFGGAVLRRFLLEIGIYKDVVFHTLRACFATHLLSSGAEAAKVMSIGGWQDFKTFQIYIRLAGVNVKGVTDRLLVLPVPIMTNVLKLQEL